MDPSLISDPKEQKWVAEISEILDRQLEIKVEIPPVSIFQIPETITTNKPEAYKPQHVGFGPYHHFQPGPYSKMQQKKLVLLQRLLQDHKINDFRHTVLDRVEKLVPVIRACYEAFLQDDNVSLAWVFAIDGLFLLNLFQTNIDDKHPKLDPTKRLILAQDIMMVENQIPFLVLKEINEALHSSSGTNFPPSSSTAIHSPGGLQGQMVVENQIPCTVMNEIEEVSNSDLLPSIYPSFTHVIHSPPLQEQMEIENQIPCNVIFDIEEASYSDLPPSIHPSFTGIPLPPLQEQMMVDNQILPSAFRSSTTIQPLPISRSLGLKNFSPSSLFRSFSETHSPFELCSPLQAPSHVQHLLHYIYRSIINNNPLSYIPPVPLSRNKPSVKEKICTIWSIICMDSSLMDKIISIALNGSEGHMIPFNASKITTFVNNIPKKEIVQLYEQTITTLHNFSSKKVIIPSASELQGRAGFRFDEVDGAVENVYIGEKTIYLPRVTLNDDSEVILRNLVAYEALLMPHSDHLPITEYMGLMCGLVVNVEDVKLLKKENIIKGELGEAEVAKIFVGMSGSILSLKTKNKSKLQEVIDKINKVYERKPRTRAYLLMRKLANWVLVGLTHVGSFVGATWKIVAFIISIVTVFMLTYQAYCDVYGCDKNNVTLLPYASS